MPKKSVDGQSDRITARLDVMKHTPFGKLLAYLQDKHRTQSYREAAERALKAFFLLEALDGQLTPGEQRAIAKESLNLLQSRMVEIIQQYLPDEPLMIWRTGSFPMPIMEEMAARPVKVSAPTPSAMHPVEETEPPQPKSFKAMLQDIEEVDDDY